MSILRAAPSYAYSFREPQQTGHYSVCLSSTIPSYGAPATYEKREYNGIWFYTGQVTDSYYRAPGRSVVLTTSGEYTSVDRVWYLRFQQPINPKSYCTRLYVDGAGGKLNVPRAYVTGDVTAVIRYTLMSVDWVPTSASFKYDNQPTPGGDDPHIDVTLTAGDGYQVAKRCSVLEFTGLEYKDYYGVKVEVLSLTGYTLDSSGCDDIVIPEYITYADSGTIYGRCFPDYPECEINPCLPGVGIYTYQDGPCFVRLTLGGPPECTYLCEPIDDFFVYWSKDCSYPVIGSEVTFFASPTITVSCCDFGKLRIYTNQPRTEVEVVRRSLTSNYATLKTAAPHGLYAYPEVIVGVDSTNPVQIASTSRSANYVTVTTATPHGLVAGDNVQLWGSSFPGTYHTVYAPVTASSFVVYSAGTSYATRPEGGSVRKYMYDRSGSGITVVDATTVRYYCVGPNEAETPCSGKLIML